MRTKKTLCFTLQNINLSGTYVYNFEQKYIINVSQNFN